MPNYGRIAPKYARILLDCAKLLMTKEVPKFVKILTGMHKINEKRVICVTVLSYDFVLGDSRALVIMVH